LLLLLYVIVVIIVVVSYINMYIFTLTETDLYLQSELFVEVKIRD